jgi:hypothetical protein
VHRTFFGALHLEENHTLRRSLRMIRIFVMMDAIDFTGSKPLTVFRKLDRS